MYFEWDRQHGRDGRGWWYARTDGPENSWQASMLNAGAANFVAMTWKTVASLSQAHLNQACRTTQPTRR